MKKLILIILLLPVIILGIFYVMFNSTKQVDVTWTEADFESYLEKSGITFDGTNATLDQIILNEYVSVGEMEIDAFGTHEEITARLNKATAPGGLIQEPRVRFRDDGRVEFSCIIGDNFDAVYSRYPEALQYKTVIESFAGKSVYFVQELSLRDDKQGFDASFENFYLGNIPIPVGTANSYGGDLGTEANYLINTLEGFAAEEFYFDNQGMYFKGSVPEKLERTALP